MANSLVAEKRRKWLKRKKMSLKQFAQSTGQQFNTVYKWQVEGRSPLKPYLEAILRVHPDWPR